MTHLHVACFRLSLLVVVLWTQLSCPLVAAQTVSPNIMNLQVQIQQRVADPLAYETIIANMIRVAVARVKVHTVVYNAFTAVMYIDVADAVPTNEEVRSTAFPIADTQLTAAGFTSMIVFTPPSDETDYTIFYVAIGCAGGGMLLSAAFVAACCMRRDKKEQRLRAMGHGMDEKSRMLLEKNANETAALRARLNELEVQMISLQHMEQEERRLQSIVRNTNLKDLGLGKDYSDDEDDDMRLGETPVRVNVSTAEHGSKDKKSAAPVDERSRSMSQSFASGGGSTSKAMTAGGTSPPRRSKKTAINSANPYEEEMKSTVEDERERKAHWWKGTLNEAMEGAHQEIDTKALVGFRQGSHPDALGMIDGNHWCVEHGPLPSLSYTIARLVSMAPSNIHGVGIFAKTFIDPGVTLFPYLRPDRMHSKKCYASAIDLDFRYGADWKSRLRFITEHPEKPHWYCVAEDPTVRGWGCLINSSVGTALEANCEIVWTGASGGIETPWVRTKSTLPPLAELLLEYRLPGDEVPTSQPSRIASRFTAKSVRAIEEI